MKTKIRTSHLIMISFLMLIGLFSVMNCPLWFSYLSDYVKSKITIQDLSKHITEVMDSDDFYLKDELITLNGLFGKMSGRRLYNTVILLKNGMLTESYKTLDVSAEKMRSKARALTDLDAFISQRGGRFIYIHFPRKSDVENELMPDGYVTSIQTEVENLLMMFQNAGIDVIDTTPLLTGTVEDIEANYYRTDHHWKPLAAFTSYQMIMDHLSALYPDEPYDDSVCDPKNWTFHEMPDQFLGTKGKHVGRIFGGLDSLEWITPNFDTELSSYIANKNYFRHGDYTNVFIRDKYLKPNKDIMHTNNYYVYMGGDNDLTITYNPNAYSDQTLLVIKDSYSIPLLTFLSMQFRKIVALDPRLYISGSIYEYIDQYRPDIVMLAMNTSSIRKDEYFSYAGEADEFLSEEKRQLVDTEIAIRANNKANNYENVFDGFENERYYTVMVRDIYVTEGNADGFTIGLYDPKSKKILSKTVLDIQYCNKYGDCSWTFKTPDSGSRDLRLVIYSGIKGKTKVTGLKLGRVSLYERFVAE